MGKELSLFERPHHQKILKALHAFDADLLTRAKCYFAGGTAIAMCLGEYRKSVDIDFLCADIEGYRLLRNTVSGNNLGKLIKPGTTDVAVVRDVRTDQNKIYTLLQVEDTTIKLELVKEGRVAIAGAMHPVLPVPMLSRTDLYAQKLLANADRGLDTATNSRDIIDLGMMIQGWGGIPHLAWYKAYAPYGDVLYNRFQQSVGKIGDLAYLRQCLRSMEMDERLADAIGKSLRTASSQLPLNEADRREFHRRFDRVPALARMAGAPNTLGKHLAQAIADTPDGKAVDWATSEIDAALECIFEHNQQPHEVIEAIVQHSPGTASAERQKSVAKYIEENLHHLKGVWFESALDRLQSGQPECQPGHASPSP